MLRPFADDVSGRIDRHLIRPFGPTPKGLPSPPAQLLSPRRSPVEREPITCEHRRIAWRHPECGGVEPQGCFAPFGSKQVNVPCRVGKHLGITRGQFDGP